MLIGWQVSGRVRGGGVVKGAGLGKAGRNSVTGELALFAKPPLTSATPVRSLASLCEC